MREGSCENCERLEEELHQAHQVLREVALAAEALTNPTVATNSIQEHLRAARMTRAVEEARRVSGTAAWLV